MGVEGNLVEMSRPAPPRARGATRTVRPSASQRAFGYTEEDLKLLLTPMATTGKEPLGSMGNDAPMPALSSAARMLFRLHRFTQSCAGSFPTRRWTGSVRRSSPRLNPPSALELNLLADSRNCTPRRSLSRLPVVNS